MKFIYVFDESAKSKLLGAGFVLLKEDVDNSIYVFHFDGNLTFANEDVSYVLSDTLSF